MESRALFHKVRAELPGRSPRMGILLDIFPLALRAKIQFEQVYIVITLVVRFEFE